MRKSDYKNYTILKKEKKWLYEGEIYTIKNNEKEIKSIKFIFLALYSIISFLIIVLMVLKNPISYYIYFALPLIFQFSCIVIQSSSIFYLFKYGTELTLPQYKISYRNFKACNSVNTICSILACVGLLYITFVKYNFYISYVILSLELCVLILLLCTNKFITKIKWISSTGKITGKL